MKSIERKREKQRHRAAGTDPKKEVKEQQAQYQLGEARMEVMEYSDPKDCSDYGDAIASDGATSTNSA